MTSNNSYEYIDRESIGESLLCKLCSNPFINPVVTQCDYTYCGACIEPKIRSGSNCPSRSCNQLLTTAHLKSNTSMSLTISILDNLKGSCPERRIDCARKDVGCSWSGPRNTYDEHMNTCLFEKLRPMIDILYKVIEKQSFHIEELQKQKTQLEQKNAQVEQQKTQLEQQKTELGQQTTQLDQQKTKLKQQTTELG
ncbi:unnamed protein product [Rotaria magnacalcarata]|uniref:RING-type domain-containing protein n=2 Tax=Rotaria magnacalcarata TaxID=392030 RepID=A0A816GQ20_9BILA|nr:unnamed protein product [Rotaria magnacalcarata]CAF4344212.1 unnamed protein product [Rotaria magnacalcarata]